MLDFREIHFPLSEQFNGLCVGTRPAMAWSRLRLYTSCHARGASFRISSSRAMVASEMGAGEDAGHVNWFSGQTRKKIKHA